jgi:hypothetical protein
MTLEQCRWIVLRLSGVLWTEFGGQLNKWDGLAIRLLRRTPKRRSRAFDFFFQERLPLELAGTVWKFISQLRKDIDADPGTSEEGVQELLERLASDGDRGGEDRDGARDGSAPADDLSGTMPGVG